MPIKKLVSRKIISDKVMDEIGDRIPKVNNLRLINNVPTKKDNSIKEVTINGKSFTILSQEDIDSFSDIDNYDKEEIAEGIQFSKWYLELILNEGTIEELKEFINKTGVPYLVEKAIEQLDKAYKQKFDGWLNEVQYLEIEYEYQLDNTLRLFRNEEAIAIGNYEQFLILSSDKHCHVIDTKKFTLDNIHSLFTNGKINVFYEAEETFRMLKNKKILMSNNIFEVCSAYELVFKDVEGFLNREDIHKRIDAEIGNYSDKEKRIKKIQRLLFIRKELRQQIIDKKLIQEAKDLFKAIAKSFTIEKESLAIGKALAQMFDGEIILAN